MPAMLGRWCPSCGVALAWDEEVCHHCGLPLEPAWRAEEPGDERTAPLYPAFEQLDLFTDYQAEMTRRAEEAEALRRERCCQQAVLEIRRRFGKNAILRGMNLQEGATAMDRNRQIGGHKA